MPTPILDILHFAYLTVILLLLYLRLWRARCTARRTTTAFDWALDDGQLSVLVKVSVPTMHARRKNRRIRRRTRAVRLSKAPSASGVRYKGDFAGAAHVWTIVCEEEGVGRCSYVGLQWVLCVLSLWQWFGMIVCITINVGGIHLMHTIATNEPYLFWRR